MEPQTPKKTVTSRKSTSPKKPEPKRSTSPKRSSSPKRERPPKTTIGPLPELTDEIILSVRSLKDLINLMHINKSTRQSVGRLLPEILRRRYHLYRRNAYNLTQFIYDLLEAGEIGTVKQVLQIYGGLYQNDNQHPANPTDTFTLYETVGTILDFSNQKLLENYMSAAPANYDWQRFFGLIELNFDEQDPATLYSPMIILAAAMTTEKNNIVNFMIKLWDNNEDAYDKLLPEKEVEQTDELISNYENKM
jgi:hypothetical protein